VTTASSRGSVRSASRPAKSSSSCSVETRRRTVSGGSSTSPAPGALHEARETFLLRARDEDTIVVLVAGHGVLSELGDYWFLTPAATPARPYAGVPRRDLEALVTWQRLHARRRIMFLDTCHAGATVGGTSGGARRPRYSNVEGGSNFRLSRAR
jgi:uncharacterized caspase-like protein